MRANSCFHDLSASASAEDCHFSPQRCGVRREAQSDAPSSRRSLRLCGESLVFPAEAEAGFRHPYPQDRSVKTAAVAAGIAADGRTSKTGCRSREIVQAGASPASGLLRADRVDDVGARLRANSCAEVPGACTLFSAFSAANLLFADRCRDNALYPRCRYRTLHIPGPFLRDDRCYHREPQRQRAQCISALPQLCGNFRISHGFSAY